MLDAQSHRKWLGLHGNTMLQKHRKGISGAVANGKNRRLDRDLFSVLQHQGLKASVPDDQIRHLAFKAHLSAQI